jgi:hypothetical protein
VAYRNRDTSHVGRFLVFPTYVIDPVCKTLACSKFMRCPSSIAYWASFDFETMTVLRDHPRWSARFTNIAPFSATGNAVDTPSHVRGSL